MDFTPKSVTILLDPNSSAQCTLYYGTVISSSLEFYISKIFESSSNELTLKILVGENLITEFEVIKNHSNHVCKHGRSSTFPTYVPLINDVII